MRDPALSAAAKRAEDAVRAHVQQRLPNAATFSFGAIDIDPAHLAIWVTTDTDQQRDELAGDADLLAVFRSLLAEVGYPRDAIDGVGFAFESEETVQRNFGGDWRACVK